MPRARRNPAPPGRVLVVCTGRGEHAERRLATLQVAAGADGKTEFLWRPTSPLMLRHGADGPQTATPRRCPACGHDPVSDVLDAQDAAWRAVYRAGTEWLTDVRVAAFGDGWRAGLAAGVERGTAA